MTKENYIKMTRPFREHPEMARGIHIANKLCTGLMYLAYPILIAYLFLQKDVMLIRAILVPAISFVLLSMSRYVINRKRPYEKFEVEPVIKKDTRGKSFPSRHVFSASIIAWTFLYASPWMWLGVIFFVVAIILGVVRVISGVHYISDVIAGVAVAVISAWIGFGIV